MFCGSFPAAVVVVLFYLGTCWENVQGFHRPLLSIACVCTWQLRSTTLKRIRGHLFFSLSLQIMPYYIFLFFLNSGGVDFLKTFLKTKPLFVDSVFLPIICIYSILCRSVLSTYPPFSLYYFSRQEPES